MCITALAAGLGLVGGALNASSNNHAATQAANAQAQGATEAARITQEGTDRALGLQTQVYNDNRALEAPTSRAGAAAFARQMVLSGSSPEEARAYYTRTVAALENPSVGGATGDPAQYVLSRPDLKALAEQQAATLGQPVTNDTYRNFGAAYLADPANAAAIAGQTTSPTDAAAELGDLSQWAPQTFSFDSADVYKDPGYQFRLDQGDQALKRAAAARGQFFSGAALKAAADFNSGLASQEYGTAYNRALGEFNLDQNTKWNRLSAISGAGADATGAIENAGASYGTNGANLIISGANAGAEGVAQAANARATGYANRQNPVAGAFGGALGAGLTAYQYRMPRPAPTTAGYGNTSVRFS